MPYACVNEDDNAVVVLLTRLDNGDTDAFCGPCFVQFCAGVAQETAAPADSTDGGDAAGPAQGTGPAATAPDVVTVNLPEDAGGDSPPPPPRPRGQPAAAAAAAE